jgi:hypothetical protein
VNGTMLTVEFPSGSILSFDSPEALARAVQNIRAARREERTA